MSRVRNSALHPFARIFAADAIVRSAYQMGKTPVLPLFAAMLGASDILLGLVVSVSTPVSYTHLTLPTT